MLLTRPISPHSCLYDESDTLGHTTAALGDSQLSNTLGHTTAALGDSQLSNTLGHTTAALGDSVV